MCNAFATIDYARNIPDAGTDSDTSDDITYGIWSHEGDFTFEAVVTPYDINGYGTDDSARTPPTITASKKIMPALAQSVFDASEEGDYESNLYLSKTARLTHEMMIFYSTNFQVSLVNSTTTNENSPAEYKIRVRLKLGSTTETIDSAVVIKPNLERHFSYNSSDLKEPLYINNLFHIACSWVNATQELTIYLNGNSVKRTNHSQTNTFSFPKENFYIGANGTGSTGAGSAVTNKQFMGELHELSFENQAKKSFVGINNLLPNYDNTLLYLRFEEVDF